MEALQQACNLYIKANHHQESLAEDDKARLESDIQRFIMIAIKEATAQQLFRNALILASLKSALKIKAEENSDVMPIARAFSGLEKYILLLVEHPWKPELKQIKMYGGFYRTKIKSVLPDCESIFMKAGYVISDNKCVLKYKGPVEKEALLHLAFDCKVAFVECKTIAENYKKVKGLSMSLSDAVSMTLQDESSRDKRYGGYNSKPGNGLIIKSANSNVMLPPAVPKRQPIINGSALKQNLKPQAVYEACQPTALHENPNLDNLERQFKAMGYPNKSLQRHLNNPYSPTTKSPLTPSGAVMHEAFTYIDAQSDEILPELPHGTNEDHMRESLKHVDQQEGSRQQSSSIPGSVSRDPMQKADNWSSSWCRNWHSNGSVPSPHQLEMTGVPVPRTNICRGRPSYAGDPSMDDEGIEQDMPSKASFQSPGRPASMSQPVLPNRHQQSFIPAPSDHGYRTLPHSENNYNQAYSQMMLNSQPIFHPPLISTDGTSSYPYNMRLMSSHNIGPPPPIPSRALKPRLQRMEADDVDGNAMRASQQITSAQMPRPCVTRSQQPMYAVPEYINTPMVQPSSEPVLRREHPVVGKSKSLKYEGAVESLRQQAATTRTARSMDLTSTTWECKGCTAINTALDLTCAVCSHSRHGPEVMQPAYGQTQKACPSCTFNNNSTKENCEMCGSKLEDSFTFV